MDRQILTFHDADHPTFPVELPFDVTADRLELDPSSKKYGDRRVKEAVFELFSHMQKSPWLAEEEDDIIERVFRSAVVLYQAKAGTFAQCLDTGMIWEFG